MNNKRFVRRNEKVNFMEVAKGEFNRMKFFTAMGEEKNPMEYSRQYVDEAYERVDVVGISSGVSFSMDQRTNDEVHEIIVDIFENEKLGDDATVTILSVDFTKPIELTEDGTAYKAKKRDFSVIPGSEGGEAEVYSYEGTLRAKGATIDGFAIFDSDAPIDELETCTFQEEVYGDGNGDGNGEGNSEGPPEG